MARVFIGVGHGGTDPGAVGYLVEKDVNLKMARACYDYLQARGIDTRISRTGDVTDKLVSKIDIRTGGRGCLCLRELRYVHGRNTAAHR